MIVASLLLILVAVTLLVLGLAGGSSTLLISSIVASLLAAVALVVGARHAAAQRRTGGPDGLSADPTAEYADLPDFTAEPVGAGTRADRYATSGAGRSTGHPFADPTSEGHLPDGPGSDGAISDSSGVAGFGDAEPVSGDRGNFDPVGARPADSAADDSEVTERDGSGLDRGGSDRFGDDSDRDRPDRDLPDAAAGDAYLGSSDAQPEDGVHPAGAPGDLRAESAGVPGDRHAGSAGPLGGSHLGTDGTQDGDDSHATSDFSGSGVTADDLAASDHDSVDARRDRVSGPGRAASDFSSSADLRADSGTFADQHDAGDLPHGQADRSRPADPDYDRASSVIGAARSAEPPDTPWGRDPLDGGETAAPPADAFADPAAASFADPGPHTPPPGRGSSEPDYLSPPAEHLSQSGDHLGRPADQPDRSADHLSGPGGPAGDSGPPAEHLSQSGDHLGGPIDHLGGLADHLGGPADRPGRPGDPLIPPAEHLSSPGGRGTSRPDYLGDLLGHDAPESGGAAAAGPGHPAREFDEPDDEDPADEPLPQAVRPGDAVRVAQLDAEVVVVDGRPRYHMADCGHLAGRLGEPLPVREAVELGFSPCGQCRPVDRLVAGAARR